jgi:hypothetical protein
VALANGREAWEAYWCSPEAARHAWTFLRRDADPADYDALWREKPDPRLEVA